MLLIKNSGPLVVALLVLFGSFQSSEAVVANCNTCTDVAECTTPAVCDVASNKNVACVIMGVTGGKGSFKCAGADELGTPAYPTCVQTGELMNCKCDSGDNCNTAPPPKTGETGTPGPEGGDPTTTAAAGPETTDAAVSHAASGILVMITAAFLGLMRFTDTKL